MSTPKRIAYFGYACFFYFGQIAVAGVIAGILVFMGAKFQNIHGLVLSFPSSIIIFTLITKLFERRHKCSINKATFKKIVIRALIINSIIIILVSYVLAASEKISLTPAIFITLACLIVGNGLYTGYMYLTRFIVNRGEQKRQEYYVKKAARLKK